MEIQNLYTENYKKLLRDIEDLRITYIMFMDWKAFFCYQVGSQEFLVFFHILQAEEYGALPAFVSDYLSKDAHTVSETEAVSSSWAKSRPVYYVV